VHILGDFSSSGTQVVSGRKKITRVIYYQGNFLSVVYGEDIHFVFQYFQIFSDGKCLAVM